MKLGELSAAERSGRLRTGTLLLDIHPFVARIRTDIAPLHDELARLYANFDVLDDGGFADFHVAVLGERGVAGGFRPQARFYYDGKPAFLPLPRHHALPMLEWGLNWCVASHAHQYLVIHAAVLARGGRALVMPAPPGAGKSTLTAALAHAGWRLLSDELALYEPETGLLWGMARPINLKNRSIDLIRHHAPGATMSAPVPDTAKGLVALLAAPADSVARRREPARPAWIVLPGWADGADAVLEPAPRAETLLLMAEQSFNYDIHGERGFEAMADIVDRSRCLQLDYGSLADAEALLDALTRDDA